MSYARALPLLPMLMLLGCSSTTISSTSESDKGGTSASTISSGGSSATTGGTANTTLAGGLGSGGTPTPSGGTVGASTSGGFISAIGGVSTVAGQGGAVGTGSAGTPPTSPSGGAIGFGGTTASAGSPPSSMSGGAVGFGGTTGSAGTLPTSVNGGAIGFGATGGIAGNAGSTDGGASCGAYQPAEITPLYLVFMYDKSGSMGDDPNGLWSNLASRWVPMKQGMGDFFSAVGSPRVRASLEFFPAPGDFTTTCHADYKTPTVEAVSLATPQPLLNALDSTIPGGGTPTLPAVMGGIAHAKQLMTANLGSKAVMVLITDGEPLIYDPTTGTNRTDCTPVGSTLTNTIADIVSVVSAAYRGAPPVLTYVIGIGEAQADMASIATAGGTQYVQLDATSPPDSTRAKLTSTLKSVYATQFQCTMSLPTGASFQKDLLNISFQHSNGTIEQFSQATNCTNPGWYYDNPTTPTKIVLCPTVCAAVQSDPTGSLQFQLGCPTRAN